MIFTIVNWRPLSNMLQDRTLIQLAYPMRDSQQAIEMFKKEYPLAKDSELSTTTCKKESAEELFKSFESAGCVRFWNTY